VDLKVLYNKGNILGIKCAPGIPEKFDSGMPNEKNILSSVRKTFNLPFDLHLDRSDRMWRLRSGFAGIDHIGL
jgi:hypothetical protein